MKNTILEEFYTALAGNKTLPHIPRSDVFYVQKKYFLDTGHWVSLDRMERAMFLEGMLERRDVLDPDRTRDWE